MPYMRNGKRDYRREYDLYQGKPEQIKNRDARNKARSEMAKAGLVHKGDGKDVDHTKPISKGGDPTARSNLRVVSKGTNRSFARTSTSKLQSQTSRKERKK